MESEETYTPNPPELDGCADMSSLIYLEEENVMYNLRIRFDRKTVYTGIAKILISINPYEWLPLYTDELIKRYEANSLKDVPDSSIEPHCYNVASIAYNDMNSDIKSQSLIVCGESGSGKTESAKALMSFLAKTKAPLDSDRDFCSAVLSVNPILEAFGNAKTLMNNNSSRFGKFTKMIFTDYDKANKQNTSRLVGSYIKSYLLEKSRVIMQSQGERNFHIFFQVFEALAGDSKYALTIKEDFYYLSQTEEHKNYHVVKGQNDSKNFQEVVEALKQINVSEEISTQIFDAVVAILHMGNVKFVQNEKDISIDPSTVSNFEKISELLAIESEILRKKLTEKKFKIMSEIVISPFSIVEAVDNRNSIAKSLYDEIFKWIIQKCNDELLLIREYSKLRFIGILDVFGFECFERNSFEQFCINFANERLQQLFSESLLLSEQKEYLKEGIAWVPLKIPSNRGIMKLIDAKPNGIFSQLEAACNMPKGKPELFVNNVFKNNSSNKLISKVKPTSSLLATLREDEKFNGFKIKHYADTVIYNCNEFLSKNTDRVSLEIFEMLSTSKNSAIKEMFPEMTETSKKGSSMKNIGDVFTRELDGLIKILKSTSNFFVRCVNPNKVKSSTEFDENHVKKQLRSGGLVQVLKVIKLGYPTRSRYETLSGYKTKITSHPILENLNEKEYWNAILTAFNIDEDKYQFGLTKIFFKSNINFISEIQNFDGHLTEEMIGKIRKKFVERRLRVMKGIVYTYIRTWDMISNLKINETVSISLAIYSGITNGIKIVRESIRKEREEEERKRREEEEKKKELERLAAIKEEERQREEEEARRKEELLEEKNKKIAEERFKAKEEEQKKMEELKRKEKELQEKAKEEMERIENERKENLRIVEQNMKKQREEEEKSMEKKKQKFEEQFETSKKLKLEEISRLEEKIESLKKTADEIFEKSESEKKAQADREKEFETKIRDKIEKEREEAMQQLKLESKQKTEAMADKLSEIEKEKLDEIEAMYADNERRLQERKNQIDEYEEQSKERIIKFQEESMSQLEQMKMITSESQNKMKIFIDSKLEEIEELNKELEEKKTMQEKEFSRKMEEITFDSEKTKNDLEHMKKMTEIEIENMRIEVQDEKKNVESLEKLYKEQLDDLHKRSKALKSKEAKAKKKTSGKKKKESSYKKKVVAYDAKISSEAEKLQKLLSQFRGVDQNSILLGLQLDTHKAHYKMRKERALNRIKTLSREILKESEEVEKLDEKTGRNILTFITEQKLDLERLVSDKEEFLFELARLSREVENNRNKINY